MGLSYGKSVICEHLFLKNVIAEISKGHEFNCQGTLKKNMYSCPIKALL